MCGGDHSIPIPGVAALCGVVEGKVGHLHIDSHLDNLEDVGGERNTMASPVIRLLENPNVNPENVVIIGVRGASNPPEAISRAREMGIRVISMIDVIDEGVDAAIARALDAVWDGTDSVYVSFDNDSMDASYAPGTTAPEPFGFTSREVVRMAMAIGARGVGMIDIAELSPSYDPAAITARIDLYFVLYLLSAYARAIEQGEARAPVYARTSW
jgi:agmatinase